MVLEGLFPLHSPPCLGLGPRGAHHPSTCPLRFCPNCFHSNWGSQIQNLFAWGNRGKAKRGLLWAARFLQAPSLLLSCSLLVWRAFSPPPVLREGCEGSWAAAPLLICGLPHGWEGDASTAAAITEGRRRGRRKGGRWGGGEHSPEGAA